MLSNIAHCPYSKEHCQRQVALGEQEARYNIDMVRIFLHKAFGIECNPDFTVRWSEPGKSTASWDGKKLSFDIVHSKGNEQTRFSGDPTIVAHEMGHFVQQLLRAGKPQLPYSGIRNH